MRRSLSIAVIACHVVLCNVAGQLCSAALRGAPLFARDATLDEVYDKLETRRRLQIARLHAYAVAGRFPTNTDFPGELVPYFVSHDGTDCAVGHLVRMDGGGSLVDPIAASNNHVRVADVRKGPLVDWIRQSGLTQDECALIQPSYACIEDYRQGQQWLDEQERLQKHFDEVEGKLRSESERSLAEALIAKIDTELAQDPNSDAMKLTSLTEALGSDEPSVRVAAAYAISKLAPENASRAERIRLLSSNLADPDRRVRFWTAVALERVGSASLRGSLELHRKTLPVFLEALRAGEADLRLPSLVQLASVTPECIGTNRQFRIVTEIRRAIVDACGDEDVEVRDSAREIIAAWRWQRVAYESQRMRRHYLVDSYELESLAAETSALGCGYVDLPTSVEEFVALQSVDDSRENSARFLQNIDETLFPTAATEDEAKQLVESYHLWSHRDYLKEGNPRCWEIESVTPDKYGLYFAVSVVRTDDNWAPKVLFVVPTLGMRAPESDRLGMWFQTVRSTERAAWPAVFPPEMKPSPALNVVLGEIARNGLAEYAATCDLLVYFMANQQLVIIDREMNEAEKTLTWSGRIALLRAHQPRFFEQGGRGGYELGGGGWDFYRWTIACDRSTGVISLSAESIPYDVAQLPPEMLSPPWLTEELRLMGWQPLQEIDFFGDMLLPAEYSQAVDSFDRDKGLGQSTDRTSARNLIYRRWAIEKSLPNPYLVMALLFDRDGQVHQALQLMERAVNEEKLDPVTLADVARWEFSVGDYASARAHAEAALKLWPEHPAAKRVLEELAAESR